MGSLQYGSAVHFLAAFCSFLSQIFLAAGWNGLASLEELLNVVTNFLPYSNHSEYPLVHYLSINELSDGYLEAFDELFLP